MTRTPQSSWTPAEIAERDSDLRHRREPLSLTGPVRAAPGVGP